MEAAGYVTPTIVAFVTVAVGLVLLQGAPEFTTLLLFFSSPLFIGWFLFQEPLLTFVKKRLPAHSPSAAAIYRGDC